MDTVVAGHSGAAGKQSSAARGQQRLGSSAAVRPCTACARGQAAGMRGQRLRTLGAFMRPKGFAFQRERAPEGSCRAALGAH
jgi:hypothetical protein